MLLSFKKGLTPKKRTCIVILNLIFLNVCSKNASAILLYTFINDSFDCILCFSNYHNEVAVGLNQDRIRPPVADQHSEFCFDNINWYSVLVEIDCFDSGISCTFSFAKHQHKTTVCRELWIDFDWQCVNLWNYYLCLRSCALFQVTILVVIFNVNLYS